MLTDGQDILEGRFKIIKKLGNGAFGEIYKGKSCFCSTLSRTRAPPSRKVTSTKTEIDHEFL